MKKTHVALRQRRVEDGYAGYESRRGLPTGKGIAKSNRGGVPTGRGSSSVIPFTRKGRDPKFGKLNIK